MSDPKYNKYAGTVRFDDDNIVDIDLQPDTENIRVLLNGSEVTGGGGGLFVITISSSGIGPGATYSSNKTLAEISEAYNAGMSLVAKFDNGLDRVTFHQLYDYKYSEDSITSFEFYIVSAGNDGFLYNLWSITDSGVSLNEYTT